MILSKKN